MKFCYYTYLIKCVRRYHKMERKITAFLEKWKDDILRKPLILYGGRGVGKTYSAIDFGKKCYQNIAYFDTSNDRTLREILLTEKSIERLVEQLKRLNNIEINKKETLLIFDQVQDIELAKALKVFGKFKNDYHVILITSRKEDIPLYKGEEFQYKMLHRMDFEEFLWANHQHDLADFIRASYENKKSCPFHKVAMEYYHHYLMIGGLPQAVKCYIDSADPYQLSMVHQQIIDIHHKEIAVTSFLIDISRGIEVFDSIVYQLQKENKKFQYGLLGNGSRSKEYENAIEKLNANYLVHRSYKIKEVKKILSTAKEKDSFKLYYTDTGLLYTLLHQLYQYNFTNRSILTILYENDTATTLVEAGYSLYYYQSKGKAEVDFVVQTRAGAIVPIEVPKMSAKSKSLSLFLKTHTVKQAIRVTEKNFMVKNNVFYLPAYALFCLKELN